MTKKRTNASSPEYSLPICELFDSSQGEIGKILNVVTLPREELKMIIYTRRMVEP